MFQQPVRDHGLQGRVLHRNRRRRSQQFGQWRQTAAPPLLLDRLQILQAMLAPQMAGQSGQQPSRRILWWLGPRRHRKGSPPLAPEGLRQRYAQLIQIAMRRIRNFDSLAFNPRHIRGIRTQHPQVIGTITQLNRDGVIDQTKLQLRCAQKLSPEISGKEKHRPPQSETGRGCRNFNGIVAGSDHTLRRQIQQRRTPCRRIGARRDTDTTQQHTAKRRMRDRTPSAHSTRSKQDVINPL